MNPMKKTIVALVVLFACAGEFAWGGGEIGNGRFVPYADRLFGFELQVPRIWNRYSFGNAVSFVENALPAQLASVVNVSSDEFPEIKTVADLQKRLNFFHPLMKWEPITLADRAGFKSTNDNEGMIYLLRSESTVVSIRFRARSDEQARKDVDTVLQSLKFR